MTMKFGLQLYTLRRAFRDDPVATLERVRALGYDEVEFAAPLDMDFAALRRRMDAVGLACPSAHVGLDDLRHRPAEVLRMGELLGCRYLVMPYLTPEQRQWDEVIGALDGLARTVTSSSKAWPVSAPMTGCSRARTPRSSGWSLISTGHARPAKILNKCSPA